MTTTCSCFNVYRLSKIVCVWLLPEMDTQRLWNALYVLYVYKIEDNNNPILLDQSLYRLQHAIFHHNIRMSNHFVTYELQQVMYRSSSLVKGYTQTWLFPHVI